MQHILRLLVLAVVAHGSTLRRRDPGFQSIPSTGQKDNTFDNGAPARTGEPADNAGTPPDIYGARSIDLPFYRLYSGNMKFFPTGQLNTPDKNTDVPRNQGGIDSANQSACGIPDNAFYDSKVAIHPYFLKYADLSRYCMQDVCISFWKSDGTSDMILKVTDICSTDPNDPTHCATPGDIKIDRAKAQVMEGYGGQSVQSVPSLQGDQYPEKTDWFFMKCWADALVQPGYADNWFAKPALPNNLKWAQAQAMQQYQNNQVAYKAKGWPTYPNGGYRQASDYAANSPPISDWKAGSEPGYTPVAGGKGWGKGGGSGSNTGSGSYGSGSSPSSGDSPAASAPAASSTSVASGPVASAPGGSSPVDSSPASSAAAVGPYSSSTAAPEAPSSKPSPLTSASTPDTSEDGDDDEECDPEL